MTTKEYLMQVRDAKQMAKCCYSKAAETRELAESVRSPALGGVPASPGGGAMADAVAKLMGREDELREAYLRYTELEQQITRQIEAMERMQLRGLLYQRYVLYKRFEDIASEMGYSWRQVMRLHRNALREFEALYGSGYLTS